jgi:hypothetical protein
MKKLNILVACEESQTITKELRILGHNAYSCDLLPCSGGYPNWHFQMDVFKVIKMQGGILQNGKEMYLKSKWDIMIAHPPCTYLAVSGARWYYHPEDGNLPINMRRPHPRYPNREKDKTAAIRFFMALTKAPIDKIVIENPIGIMSSVYRKPDQIVHPYMFGDEASKTTCLWIKNLPKLKATKIVSKGERVQFKSGKSQPKWYSDAFVKAKSNEERRTLRSKTFKGMAKAMAIQWTNIKTK